MIGGADDGPLRRAHARYVVRAASVLLAGFALTLLKAGVGPLAVCLGVAAWVVVAAAVALTGAPWPHHYDTLAPVDRAARTTAAADVAPVGRADLRPAAVAAAARIAAGLVAFGLATLAREAALVPTFGEILRSGGLFGMFMVLGGIGRLWSLRRLARRPLAAVPVTVAAVGRPSADKVVLVGPTLAWSADRQGLLSTVVPGDVLVVHLDPGTDDPAVVTASGRRGVVASACKLTPAEVERVTEGVRS